MEYKFTPQEEAEGKVAECLAENPDGYMKRWPDYILILTGDDIPPPAPADEQPAQ